MAREREITVTLLPRVWAEFERRRKTAAATGVARGLDSAVINEWLFECLMRSGSGDASAPPPAVSDDFGFDESKL